MRSPVVCPQPGCPYIVIDGDCPAGHARAKRQQAQRRTDAQRPTARQRGYDSAWRKTRAAFLARNPTCIDCGAPATDADHSPLSRAELVRRGDPNPNAHHHLEPRCHPCHTSKTNRHDGGFGNTVTPSRDNG